MISNCIPESTPSQCKHDTHGFSLDLLHINCNTPTGNSSVKSLNEVYILVESNDKFKIVIIGIEYGYLNCVANMKTQKQ